MDEYFGNKGNRQGRKKNMKIKIIATQKAGRVAVVVPLEFEVDINAQYSSPVAADDFKKELEEKCALKLRQYLPCDWKGDLEPSLTWQNGTDGEFMVELKFCGTKVKQTSNDVGKLVVDKNYSVPDEVYAVRGTLMS